MSLFGPIAFAVILTTLAAPAPAETSVVVPFALGARGFLTGDAIAITEVRGDRAKLEMGGVYLVRGTYKLASAEKATLGLYVTNGKVERPNATSPNTKIVSRGSGTFELSIRITQMGYPHVSFYPVPQGEGFGGTYFGEGETLLKSAKWYERLDGLERPPAK